MFNNGSIKNTEPNKQQSPASQDLQLKGAIWNSERRNSKVGKSER